MSDEFTGNVDTSISPARNAVAVTPHATTPLDNTSKALYVGGTGNITCRLADDSADVLFTAVPVGTILPIRVTHVRATGTTATAIVNLY